jgi:hypothetical protein
MQMINTKKRKGENKSKKKLEWICFCNKRQQQTNIYLSYVMHFTHFFLIIFYSIRNWNEMCTWVKAQDGATRFFNKIILLLKKNENLLRNNEEKKRNIWWVLILRNKKNARHHKDKARHLSLFAKEKLR